MKKYLVPMFIIIFVGCHTPRKVNTGVIDTVSAYKRAVLGNDPKAAYALLDSETKKQVPFSWYLAKWKKNRREMVYQAKKLKPGAAVVTVTYKSKAGVEIAMVTEEGRWKVDKAPGLTPAPATPAQLLSMLIKAIDTMDLALYISLLAPKYRATVIATLRAKMEELKRAKTKLPKNNSADVEQVTVPLDNYGNIQIVLKKFSDGWKVESWQLRQRRRFR